MSWLRPRALRSLAGALVMLAAPGARGGAAEKQRTETLSVAFEPGARRLNISATGLRASEAYELRIETPGLSEVELGADVNEPGVIYLPPAEGPVSLTSRPAIPAGAENVFFFSALKAAPEWELVARFPVPVHGTWKLNGRFSPLGGEVQPEIVVPVIALEIGENLLHLEGAAAVPALRYRRVIRANVEQFADVLEMTPADWSGRVLLLRSSPPGESTVIADASVKAAELAREPVPVSERWWDDRDALTSAALATGRNMLSAQITQPPSFFRGGFNLVYDPQRKSHRIAHWIWSWGPSIALLLELEKLPAAKREGLSKRFRAAAMEAGERSLGFDVTDARHPAFGVSTVRWEPSRAASKGWVEYISTADSLFLAGWGWMSLHRATGDARYLERTQRLVAAAERLMAEYPVVPQDWVVERNRWTPHTLDESVFGMIGFRELHAATKSPAVAEAGRRFLESHLKHMARESGLLERAWLRDPNRAIWDPDIKGHAWVVEGYLDAHRLSGDARYLELARALTRRVVECQHEDGAWTYLFKKPKENDPRDDKGTAIWAYMLYELHRTTRDPEHLAAARRALGWCLRHQYRGDDPNLDGALLHENGMAYVRRRPMTILYSTTFFGLALLEELRLAQP